MQTYEIEYLKLPQSRKSRKAVDLLTGKKVNVVLHPEHLLEVVLPANGGILLKINY